MMKQYFLNKHLSLIYLSLILLNLSSVFAGSVVTMSNVQFYPNCSGIQGQLVSSYDWERHEVIVNYTFRSYVNGILQHEFIDEPGSIAFWNGGNNPKSIETYAHAFTAAAPNSIYTIFMSWNGESYSRSWNCTTGEAVVQVVQAEGNSCPAFFDGRINNCDTGNRIVIYGHEYDSGRGLLIMDTEGNNLLLVSVEQIAAVAECPDTNTLIASGGGVSVYRLAGSCGYQVNGSAADGKTYVVIFDELYANAGYTSHEE